jgi:hypothetical protein
MLLFYIIKDNHKKIEDELEYALDLDRYYEDEEEV